MRDPELYRMKDEDTEEQRDVMEVNKDLKAEVNDADGNVKTIQNDSESSKEFREQKTKRLERVSENLNSWWITKELIVERRLSHVFSVKRVLHVQVNFRYT